MWLWCVWAWLPLEDDYHSLRGGLQSSGVSHGLHHPPPQFGSWQAAAAERAGTRRCLTPIQRHPQGWRGGTVSPSPPGSKQAPPPSTWLLSSWGLSLATEGSVDSNAPRAFVYKDEPLHLLTSAILCYLKGKAPLSTTPRYSNHSLIWGCTTSHSTECSLFALHCKPIPPNFSFLPHCCHICLDKPAIAPQWGKESLTSSVPSINSSSHRTESLAWLTAVTWQQLNSGDNLNEMYLKEREQATSQNITASLTLLHKELHRCWGTALHAHRPTELQWSEVTTMLCSTRKSFFSQHKTQDARYQSTLPGVLGAKGCATARLVVRHNCCHGPCWSSLTPWHVLPWICICPITQKPAIQI